jgi:hypothetical protein
MLKYRTSGAPKPEGISSLRLRLRFLGVGHMGSPEQISSIRLLDERVFPFEN